MCGIAGIVGERAVDEDVLGRMSHVLRHRGPDDQGTYVGEGVGLVHRRLAIVDLSPGGHQPMRNEAGNLWIVYNGEVYNAADLREQLDLLGHRFRSTSDTEVILHAYEEWGAECVSQFNGMWAFAIWDAEKRKLFCSRDRFGVKPFYYHLSRSGTLIFGSEIKAILAAGLEARVDTSYAAHVMVDGRLDDGPETMFLGVKQLEPAHNMTFSDGQLVTERYWEFDARSVRERFGFESEAEKVRELLSDAVRLRMLASDVQVGSCLSGGLDSSTIVSMASRQLDGPMATFSLQYGEAGYDESDWARLVAERCACEAWYVKPSSSEFFGVLEQMAWYQDEPAAGPGLFSQWRVMELAGPHVKVLLDGQGGDETMAGYRYYLEPYLRTLAASALRGNVEAAMRFTREVPRVAEAWGTSVPAAMARAFGSERAKRLYRTMQGAPSAAALTSDIITEAAVHPVVRNPLPLTGDALNDRLYADIVRDVIPSLLHYEDRNSMAFSIEARTPFLDYRLVEQALSIPGPDKVRDGQTKWLFRQAVTGVTPSEILNRKDKMGYKTPVAEWFRNGLSPQVSEVLLSPRTAEHGVLDIGAVRQGLENHAAGRIDLSWQIYRWLSLEQWFRTFIDRRDESLGPVRSL